MEIESSGPGGVINTTPMVVTDERFFLLASLSSSRPHRGVANVDDMEFGQGQPSNALGGGYRLEIYQWQPLLPKHYGSLEHILLLSGLSSAAYTTQPEFHSVKCSSVAKIDKSMDGQYTNDGPYNCCRKLPINPISCRFNIH